MATTIYNLVWGCASCFANTNLDDYAQLEDRHKYFGAKIWNGIQFIPHFISQWIVTYAIECHALRTTDLMDQWRSPPFCGYHIPIGDEVLVFDFWIKMMAYSGHQFR